jgi:hypothetical protein
MGELMPAIVIGGIILLALVFYLFSLASRRTFKCPQCGERITTDYLEAKRCGMCGAELEKETGL